MPADIAELPDRDAPDAPADGGDEGSEGLDRDPLDSRGEGRAERATGREASEDRVDRATDNPAQRDVHADDFGDGARSRDARYSLLGDGGEEHAFHLLDELDHPSDRFSLGNFSFTEKAAHERISPFIERACWMVPDGYGGMPDFARQFFGGMRAFCSNYEAMNEAWTKGADKYFHCLANCEAANLGPGGDLAAKTLSVGREIVDFFKNIARDAANTNKGFSRAARDSTEDCLSDLRADRVGWRAGENGLRCIDACRPYKVRGL